MTVPVRYSCLPCGLSDVLVEVEERGPDEDIVHWIKEVLGRALQADHRRRSPFCGATRSTDVKIPITGAGRIGGPPEH